MITICLLLGESLSPCRLGFVFAVQEFCLQVCYLDLRRNRNTQLAQLKHLDVQTNLTLIDRESARSC